MQDLFTDDAVYHASLFNEDVVFLVHLNKFLTELIPKLIVSIISIVEGTLLYTNIVIKRKQMQNITQKLQSSLRSLSDLIQTTFKWTGILRKYKILK